MLLKFILESESYQNNYNYHCLNIFLFGCVSRPFFCVFGLSTNTRIRTLWISVFSPNAGKPGPEEPKSGHCSGIALLLQTYGK